MDNDFISVLPDKIRHLEARMARIEDKVQMDEKRRKKVNKNDDYATLTIIAAASVAVFLTVRLARAPRNTEMGGAFHPSYS